MFRSSVPLGFAVLFAEPAAFLFAQTFEQLRIERLIRAKLGRFSTRRVSLLLLSGGLDGFGSLWSWALGGLFRRLRRFGRFLRFGG